MNAPGYESLRNVLQRAYDQAAYTKGAERHANDLPFHLQPMQTVAEKHGIGFIFGQIDKKSLEAHGMHKRGEHEKAVHEMLGVINYAAGAIIRIEKERAAKNNVGPKDREPPSMFHFLPDEPISDDNLPDNIPQELRQEIVSIINAFQKSFGGTSNE